MSHRFSVGDVLVRKNNKSDKRVVMEVRATEYVISNPYFNRITVSIECVESNYDHHPEYLLKKNLAKQFEDLLNE